MTDDVNTEEIDNKINAFNKKIESISQKLCDYDILIKKLDDLEKYKLDVIKELTPLLEVKLESFYNKYEDSLSKELDKKLKIVSNQINNEVDKFIKKFDEHNNSMVEHIENHNETIINIGNDLKKLINRLKNDGFIKDFFNDDDVKKIIVRKK
jgi:hypothetical protein